MCKVSLCLVSNFSLHNRKQDKWHVTLSLVHLREKCDDAVGLVKMSAKLSLLEMNWIARVLEATMTDKVKVYFDVLGTCMEG